MLYTIYKITNRINGKIYIGKHQTEIPMDNYYGSGKAIKNAIKKHNKKNFEKEILFIFETEYEMNMKEKELITEEFVLRTDTYNMGVGGEGGAHFKGRKHGIAKKQMNTSEDHRKKVSEGLLSYYENNDHCMKNKRRSDSFKKKVSDSRLGTEHKEETKEKISKSLIGRKHSEETKQKMREAKLKKK